MTPEQRELLQDKLTMWRQVAKHVSPDWRDYNRRAAEALNAALSRITLLEGHVSTLEAQQRTDRATIANQADTIARLKRAMPECKACDGTGKIEHDARADDCDACGGLGVWSL